MLIVFEGADGTGKTTAAKWLFETLKKRLPAGMSVEYTSEPTRGTFGAAIRERMQLPVEEAALFIADRVRHVREVIKPLTMASKQYLIMDRYYYSTVAYQSARNHPELNAVDLLADNESFCPKPDILFLFECDIAVAMERVGNRGAREVRFEQTDYQQRVQTLFRAIVPPETCFIDTTTMSEKAVKMAVVDALGAHSMSLKMLLENVV